MDRYEVALIDSPGDQLPFLTAFRTIGKISLADALEVHAEASNRHGTVLVAGIDRKVAEHIAATFADHDIAVSVQRSSIGIPMVCKPQANVAYRLNAARVLVAVPTSPSES